MDVLGKIKACGVALEQWNQYTFGNVTRLIRFLNDKISKVKGKTLTAEVKACFDKWKIELEELLELEEVLWKQRGKVLWLHVGDRNTTFFHHQATERYTQKLV
ncbi:UNVERIFIED_CONTAM: hypothetical protein Sradi_5536500 [Sesamum radiatum]|uniref:Uncharacterized protein n=1 Tax=Sesamum radiatum TaxID=300843 RepID=A0AAW2LEF1_SESRA